MDMLTILSDLVSCIVILREDLWLIEYPVNTSQLSLGQVS